MGDIIYPGVFLRRIPLAATEEDVIDVVKEAFGKGNRNYRVGGPSVRLIEPPAELPVKVGAQIFNNAVVSGIKLTWNSILQGFDGKRILGQHVDVFDRDFGFQRESNGLVTRNGDQYNKHLALLEGQGCAKAVAILHPDFVRKELGGPREIKNDIQFEEPLSPVEMEKISQAGLVLKSNPGRMTKSSCDDYHQMIFKHRLGMVQAVCLLNGHLKPPSRFVMAGSIRPNITKSHGLGINGTKLDIEGVVDQFGYIPFEMLDPKYINQPLKKLMRGKCIQCKRLMNVIGVDADLNWIAARCDCVNNWSHYHWFDEPFTRMFVVNRLEQISVKSGTDTIYDHDSLRIYLRGLIPLYESPLQFGEIAYVAFKMDQQHSAQALQSNHNTMGEVYRAQATDLGVCVKGKKKTRYVVDVHIPRSFIWSESGIAKVGSLSISTLNLHSRRGSAESRVFRGAIKCAVNVSETTLSLMTVILTPESHIIHPGDKWRIVPHPSTTERGTIRKSLRLWESYLTARSANPRKTCRVIHASYLTDTFFDDKSMSAWLVRILPESTSVSMDCRRKLDTHFVGATFYLCEDMVKNSTSGYFHATGRCVEYLPEYDVIDDWTSLKYLNVLGFVILLPIEAEFQSHNRRLQEFELWSIHVPGSRGVILNARAAGESDSETDSDNDDPAFFTFEDFDLCDFLYSRYGACPDTDVREKIMREYRDDGYFSNRYRKHIINHTGLDDVLAFWRTEPLVIDLSIMDHLLHEGSCGSSPTQILLQRQRSEIDIALDCHCDKLLSKLNESQVASVQLMMSSRLSCTIGPPGTGKTSVAAIGILQLLCKSSGNVLVCAPSNFAADNLYKALQTVCKQVMLPFEIVRVMGKSKEMQDIQPDSVGDINLLNENEFMSEGYLHKKVRRHPAWDTDVNRQLLEKVDGRSNDFPSAEDDRNYNEQLAMIEIEILSSCRVYVATVGTGGNRTIQNALHQVLKKSKTLEAVVVDEAGMELRRQSSLLKLPSLLPLLINGPCRVWLLGDTNQLQPCVLSPSAGRACLGISALEFMSFRAQLSGHNAVFSTLNPQMRMADRIARAVARVSYKSLTSANTVLERDYETLFPRVIQFFPHLKDQNIGIYDYSTNDEIKNRYGTITNPTESDITFTILQKLNEAGFDLSKITVIAMYDGHVRELRNRITEIYSNVEIATVDSFQGKENDVIIVNTVRANAANDCGFLRQRTRFTVAISRAIHYLFLVGNWKCLRNSKIPFLNDFYEFVVRDQGVIPQLQ